MLPSLARWLKAHDLLAYFVLTFLISWSAWVYVILTLPELDFNSIGTGGMLFMMLGQWGPALSAVLIAAFTRGKPGLKEIFGRLKYRRGSGRWFLAAGFLWVAITLASALWHAQASNQALSFHADQWEESSHCWSLPCRSFSGAVRRLAGAALPCRACWAAGTRSFPASS